MDLLEKKIEKLELTTDSVAACNTILYLAKKINEENRDRIMAALMRYGDNGLVEFHRGFAVGKVVELMDKPDSAYSDFFMSCIQSGDSNKAYWGIEGYVKAVGKAACNALIPFVFLHDFPVACKANIIMQLSKVTNNTFEQGKPIDPGFWKESNIDYGAIRQWAEQGFPCGKGFTEPVRHICLDSPETAAEKVYSKIDKKLKQKREKKQNLANPTNWLVQAEPTDMEQIDQRWHLPADYRDFLLKASPVIADLKMKGYGSITLYGAHNLIKCQDGYRYNPTEKKNFDSWNKDYLVIADRNADPFCIDLSMEESPVYFGLHGMGQWEFSEAFGNFMDFLKHIMAVGK
ncbi:SMI1/KNR4 family protein [Enterocloster sp. OA13]|uniref:SMI1/KNR4 family protein n=1 Tax=Enterocloster sp. OA13 TaxID=2914161 RepID=UPI00046FED12|nr:SMI1/KNR4 family protein [Enterocloster sp. OA13]